MSGGRLYGNWVKEGREGNDPISPGSYGAYVKRRKAPKTYSTTAQQKKVAQAGREVGAKCKGKTGGEFRKCRAEVMTGIFG